LLHILVADRTVYILPYVVDSSLDDFCATIVNRLISILSKVIVVKTDFVFNLCCNIETGLDGKLLTAAQLAVLNFSLSFIALTSADLSSIH